MYLAQKSEFNADASLILIENCCYAPSVHCAYYSVFQLMKVVMCRFLGVEYDAIDSHVATTRTSEHKYVQREIMNFVRKNDRGNYRKINNLFNDLFQFRIEADYKNIEVRIDEAKKANSHSREIISYLKTNFHV